MTMIFKAALGLAAGATLFIGYCYYFDSKRRSDPHYKRKVKERRRAKKEATSNAKSGKSQIPNLRDHEAVQMFFLQEVQQGEDLLSRGDEEGGVEHLSNAVAVCGQPNQLLKVLQQTLPPHVFEMLIMRLPAVSQIFSAQQAAAAASVDDSVD